MMGFAIRISLPDDLAHKEKGEWSAAVIVDFTHAHAAVRAVGTKVLHPSLQKYRRSNDPGSGARGRMIGERENMGSNTRSERLRHFERISEQE